MHTCLRDFIGGVDLLNLARAALSSGAHCRALLYIEQYADRRHPPKPSNFLRPHCARRELSAEALRLLHRVYSQTNEPDGLIGLSLMRFETSVEEDVRQPPIPSPCPAPHAGTPPHCPTTSSPLTTPPGPRAQTLRSVPRIK